MGSLKIRRPIRDFDRWVFQPLSSAVMTFSIGDQNPQ